MSFFDRLRPYPELKQAIVNLKSGTVFRGLVWRQANGYLILREVEMMADRDNTVQRLVDGEVAVQRMDIDFIQVASQAHLGGGK